MIDSRRTGHWFHVRWPILLLFVFGEQASFASHRELRVPQKQEGWTSAARTERFLGAHNVPARPHSEARLAWKDGTLWVLLYAADEDIRSTDAFHVEIDGRAIDATAATAEDVDGTLDDPRDDDEEWIVELAVPLQKEAGDRVRFSAHRCDTPKDSVRSCAQFGESEPVDLVLE